MPTSKLEADNACLENNLLPNLNALEFPSSTQYNYINNINNSFNRTKIASSCDNFENLKILPKLFTSIYQNNILIPQQFVVEGEPEKLSSIIDSVSSLLPSSSNFANNEFEHALSSSVKKNNKIITNPAVAIKRIVNPNYLMNVNSNNKIYSKNFQNLTTSVSSSLVSLNLALTQSSSENLNKNNTEINENKYTLNNSLIPKQFGFRKNVTIKNPKKDYSSLMKNNNVTSSSVIQLYNALQLNQSNKYEKTLFSTTCSSLHTTLQAHTNSNSTTLSSVKKNQANSNYLTKQKCLNLSNKSSKKKKVIKLLSTSVEKRNARERTRVHTVNQAFYLLKNKLPSICSNTKRVSKLKILKAAINYIFALNNIVLYKV